MQSSRTSAWPAARAWLLSGLTPSTSTPPHTTHWLRVMCLSGVDYFSTLGYQPSIAFVAAGYLSPFATVVLVLLTLLGALPVYRRIAALSPHGHGSLAVLEERLPRWRGKTFVLVLLGFAATDFIITITLSAADAAEHVIENPFAPAWLHHQLGLTLLLVVVLGAVFLRGFREVIGVAVFIVAAYLTLNVIVIGYELWQLATHPAALTEWRAHILSQQSNPWIIAGLALIYFPKLALGLSGFETGVTVMPLVRGHGESEADVIASRIAGTQRLLLTAALIMSVLLIGSAIVTATRIPGGTLLEGGPANGRALAYLAHRDMGEAFGTVYDVVTVAILWFAGASAMAGLLNLVPRYLPRYGMAPDWARATRPLVLIITGIGVLVTVLFDANVDAQGGAYATGVLVLMTSAAVAVTIAVPRHRGALMAVTAVFVYTTIANMVERPEGLRIAAWFIVAIIVSSLISRVRRSTEIRIGRIDYDKRALALISHIAGRRQPRVVASRPNGGTPADYERKLARARQTHGLKPGDPVLLLEVTPGDVSAFSDDLVVRGVDIGGMHVLRCTSPAVPNAIAGLLLDLRDRTGSLPHVYFGWTEGNPLVYLLKFLAFGEGDTAPMCREILRQAEPDPERRPRVHVG